MKQLKHSQKIEVVEHIDILKSKINEYDRFIKEDFVVNFDKSILKLEAIITISILKESLLCENVEDYLMKLIDHVSTLKKLETNHVDVNYVNRITCRAISKTIHFLVKFFA